MRHSTITACAHDIIYTNNQGNKKVEQEQISDEELAFCEGALNEYVNKCECKNLDEVHWKLRCLLSVMCEMLESIEAGRTEEIKQH